MLEVTCTYSVKNQHDACSFFEPWGTAPIFAKLKQAGSWKLKVLWGDCRDGTGISDTTPTSSWERSRVSHLLLGSPLLFKSLATNGYTLKPPNPNTYTPNPRNLSRPLIVGGMDALQGLSCEVGVDKDFGLEIHSKD